MKILQDRTICFDGIHPVSFRKGQDSGELPQAQIDQLVKLGVILDPTLDKKEAEKKVELIRAVAKQEKEDYEAVHGSTIVNRGEFERLKRIESNMFSGGSSSDKQDIIDERFTLDAEKEELETEKEALAAGQTALEEAQTKFEAYQKEIEEYKEKAVKEIEADREKLKADIAAFEKKKKKQK